MERKSGLTRNAMYRFIERELVRLYGEETASRVIALAQGHYDDCMLLCKSAPKGEWLHLNNTILPTVSIYKALLEMDPAHALSSAHTVMMNVCEKSGAVMRRALKLPGMKSVFMWLIPKAAVKMFGPDCGFRFEHFEARKDVVKMDMVACPYCRYAELFGTPELTFVFCDSDFAVYGNLPGIVFERTQTLGTGGTRCDFRFARQ